MNQTLTIISGGQTGVDRAALDAAIKLELPHGGWCPAGRRCEEGVIAEQYRLKETPSPDYVQRTEWNVRDSDATLIFNLGDLSGGTALTAVFAEKHRKPLLAVRLEDSYVTWSPAALDWLRQIKPGRLNIAGPRASKSPEIEALTREALERLLRDWLSGK